MTKTNAKASKNFAARTRTSVSFFDRTVRRRFGTAITGSLLVHILVIGAWLSTSMIHKPEVLEIREISFVDENEIPPAPVDEPEVPIGGGGFNVFNRQGGGGGSDIASSRQKNIPIGNTMGESQNGAINAEHAETEVNVNKIGVLGLLEGVSEQGGSENALSLNMQAADGVVETLKMNRSLTVGRGQNPKGEVKEGALAATSRQGRGIIDELIDIDAGEGVALKKGARVQFAGFGGAGGAGGGYGARSEASLYAVLNKNLGRLQYLYEKHLRQDPTLGGKVEVEVVIRSDGTVAKVSFISSQIRVPAFLEELAAAIRRWRYDPIDEGKVRVVYPLVFIKVG
ncbi:MAG: AgmX/PglI C-terminal domain-containing protein [candidate division KSB1 bacterium]|nr:AgmX/PglI C-terminal domain-containing protein [candidate division KSB1 bacterium]MDZ7302057.1 AgmX/PglI C-terminal domain-containing protein [candidate division KSB1 bacterium]MDZ7311099.1 AgmX/PglI C-terminal domain-containing protein [candidate division KSB1 bacterium]